MLLLFLFVLTVTTIRAQININGKVFGGACQADVGGSTFVDISADHFDVVINAVYGGNDVSGSIGTDATAKVLPFTPEVNTDTKTYVDNTFDSFIRTNLSTKKLFIGKLFGGGDGNYDYTSAKLSDGETDNPYYGMSSPVIGKTYLQINGGTISRLFGGGNNATVTGNTTICIDNTSTVVKSTDLPQLLTNVRLQEMGLNVSQVYIDGDFQFGRVFGGNNFADMAIRPRWFLKKGKIRDLYSGGNEGRMTSPEGLLLQIDADNPEAETTDADVLWIDNVYGGCRKSDVRPERSYPNAASVPVPTDEIQLPAEDNPGQAPAGYAARVRVLGGYVNNVYGGNDISGTVYGGNTVGIFTTIHGNVYGGGNGSYAYTDKEALKNDPQWGDFYYNPGSNSAAALNAHRPNAERVSIRVSGTEAKPTIVEGALYVGGNSATLEKKSSDIAKATAELKIGSYVIIDKVFLGNNGENMIDPAVLAQYADDSFSSLKLVGEGNVFDMYMDGCAMKIDPNVVFDDGVNSPDVYKPYSTQFGSFYCGGNVGSIIKDGLITVNFEDKVIIYDKLVAGCNNANVAESSLNAAYEGGVLGTFATPETGKTIGNKLILNLSGLKIQPKRWVDENDKSQGLEWNTFIDNNKNLIAANAPTGSASSDDLNRRFKGGNIYGGCYSSGIVNGNVIININATIVDRNILFDEVDTDDETGEDKLYGNTYTITKRHSGVILGQQGMDVLGKALNVFGGGKGRDTEIWGSATVNLNAGYTFQIFGGSEEGAIGKKGDDGKYTYNPAYSTYVNLSGSSNHPGVPKSKDTSDEMAQIEFIYGGGFEGPIAGDTHINLGNGRIFNTFAGSCNADIYGHTETYIGVNGFPYVRDYVYGGNDLGGKILGEGKFWSRVRDDDDNTENGNGTLAKVHGYSASNDDKSAVLNASAYIEYQQGRVEKIFGGCYGVYDYKDELYRAYFDATGKAKTGYSKPFLDNAFINFRPSDSNSEYNTVGQIYGAGQGYFGEPEENKMQNRSYILVDIPQNMQAYQSTVVFGGGECGGVGMGITPSDLVGQLDKGSAIIDLIRGDIKNVYGGSYKEGVTRRTLVNVPEGSTIKVNNIFGGAYGTDTYHPCDVYEANVNYRSATSIVEGAIYGGNNNKRRTLYGKVNISAPVYTGKSDPTTGALYLGTVYGAGFGGDSWSEYTEVNLESGAKVYEVYGGGQAGKVHNAESVQKFMNAYKPDKWPEDSEDKTVVGHAFSQDDWKYAWTLGEGYDPSDFVFSASSTSYVNNDATNLNNPLVRTAEMDDRSTKTYKYNTNVIINQGAEVSNYAYGGGLGADAVVAGTTYIALLGGTVVKDIYAAGTSGSVEDLHEARSFTASANAYIEGGSVRNVYGGGWEGSVGRHVGSLSDSDTADIPGETHVVIGIRKDQASLPEGYGFLKGVPAIQRNAFGGGEGGAVYGTTHLSLNNGYIGYEHFDAEPTTHTDLTYVKDGSDYYQEKLHDESWSDDTHPKGTPNYRLEDCGNVYGGGYDDNSNVDNSYVTVWGGLIRNSVYGGGEIATVGRGSTKEEGAKRTLNEVYHYGSTNVEMYNGHVLRDVYGGGKGFNLLGFGHKADQERRYTDGYVFGQTAVYIYGGEIGTVAGIADGYGNVFGGGNIGYVYSPGYNDPDSRKTSTGSPGHTYYYKDGKLTEDCKVVVSPRLQIKNGGDEVEYGGITYKPFDYVPTDYLNTLEKKNKTTETWSADWQNLITEENGNDRGVMIHNAVFAGGNVSSNSDQTYANATTVYGNTTATLYDVYHRDFITVGTEHTGGLYGGGNLSVVDGYRELNITNYGTDYFALESTISLEKYRSLSNRERAYFKLKYKCIQPITIENINYDTGSQPIDEELYLKYLDRYPQREAEIKAAFEPYGFCSIYAGRLLNTIQRADLCGVFGSRLVLQGAKDRVADVGDATVYTINRVGELSLNLQHSTISADQNDSKEKLHGNYFGIYSVVNYLGNLTSDVRFNDGSKHPYRDKDGVAATNGTSYYSYKEADPNSINRNIGSSYNQVALASGVFLEITTENSTEDHKDYGFITGVVELDLINVKQSGVGGGFVYAKNVHGIPSYDSSFANLLLSPYNKQADNEVCTYKQYSYPGTLQTFETSGNFIHPEKRIVDDCYPTNNAYDSQKLPYSEAHYWYVKGDVYIYDRTVSAYTGSATAYSKEVNIPLTITAASHGKLTLMNVKPNLYAYKTVKEDGTVVKIGTKDGEKEYDKVFVNNESNSYGLNDVITWWEWNNLRSDEQGLFRKETYVNCVTCKIGGQVYEPGTYVVDDTDKATLKSQFESNHATITDENGAPIHNADDEEADFDYIFRSSNNIGHDTGYVLTFDMNTPGVWDSYYSKINGTGENYAKKSTKQYGELDNGDKDKWRRGPTYYANTEGVYGQRYYNKGEIITKETKDNNHQGLESEQAEVETAYVATKSVTYNNKTYNKGMVISTTEYNTLDATSKDAFGEAFVCINAVKLDDQNYLLLNDLVTQGQIDQMKSTYDSKTSEITAALTPAFIITKKGYYGGKWYDSNTNYSAISAWSSLTSDERDHFNFNYDALDLLSDPNYLDFYDASAGHTKTIAEAYHTPYSDQVDVEYEAVFQAEAYGNDHQTTGENPQPITYLSYDNGETKIATSENPRISNTVFETQVKNDQRHYTRVNPTADNLVVDAETEEQRYAVYIANCNFDDGGIPYGKGQVVDIDVYNKNSGKVDKVEFASMGEQYYCYEDYVNASGTTVHKGNLIRPTTLTKAAYDLLTNDQKYFIIQGKEPIGVTTLYVSSESDVKDLTKERIISAIYQYTYYEAADGGGIKLTNELHVVNIHLELESGAPRIGVLSEPPTVLPGYTVGLTAPKVDPGLYEPLGNGWEIFTSSDDAENHRNGLPFDNGNTPVYWYQNEKVWVAFYSKNYLGKTYSNPVPIKVANYHDLDAVMKDKEHHMYVDHPGAIRDPKIYIDNRTCESDASKNELDLLKDFFDLSLSASGGHAPLDSHVSGCDNLEFILKSNMSPKAYTNWTPIGNETKCFSGNFHGDGHYISGLNNSLFGSLCGNVYNLGVMGSFTSAGVADIGDGYVENCWVKSEQTTGFPDGVRAVFGNPSTASNKQIVNCYYFDKNAYQVTSDETHGIARPMSEKDFYNGTVAYNLNGFYLYKRYNDHAGTTGTDYQYYTINANNNTLSEPTTGHYGSNVSYCSSGYNGGKYVEERFIDGDFRYAGGNIPESAEERAHTNTTDNKTYFYPIWPDDYIYFGQMLTYNWNEARPHEEVPSPIVKSNGRLLSTDQSNRVYRAPAYYGNKVMSVAHFNPSVNLVSYSKPKNAADLNTHPAYPGMTAIDFAGHNDATYQLGLNGSLFYQPLLDDDGLIGIVNRDETPNLLVYAPASGSKTYIVLADYFKEPVYSQYYIDDVYRRVKVAPTSTIYGHLVLSDKTSASDHLLVDKQDFNCPIVYKMGENNDVKYHMWYQREPQNFVTIEAASGKSKGWEDISLPFTAELVTTQDKGEITHFFQGSTEGHEYWLRVYDGIDATTSTTDELAAKFTYPATAESGSKSDANTFLYEYYYSKSESKDANSDIYKSYYNGPRTYDKYPYLKAGSPYLIGFPGVSYYEFDLSGNFEAKNTYAAITKLGAQTITFASAEEATIGVSDDEMASVEKDNYIFYPNYQNKELASGDFLLNSSDGGNKYKKLTASKTALPFRPYFMKVASTRGTQETRGEGNVNSIIFSGDMAQMNVPKAQNQLGGDDDLIVTAGKKKICVESQLRYTTDVRIVTPAGVTLATYSIQSSEYVETQVYSAGVYIVYADNGKYVKKVIVK